MNFADSIRKQYGHDPVVADTSAAIEQALGPHPIAGNLQKALQDGQAVVRAGRLGVPTTAEAEDKLRKGIFNAPAAPAVVWDAEDGFSDWRNDLQAQLPKCENYQTDPSFYVDDVSLDCSRCLICRNGGGMDDATFVAGVSLDPNGSDPEPVLAPMSEWAEVEQQYVTVAKSVLVVGNDGEVYAVRKAFGDKKAAPFVKPDKRDPNSTKTATGVKKADEAPAKGTIQAGDDKGSYPINTQAQLDDAISAYGRAKDPTAVKAHIIAQAKKHGLALPKTGKWGPDSAPEK